MVHRGKYPGNVSLYLALQAANMQSALFLSESLPPPSLPSLSPFLSLFPAPMANFCYALSLVVSTLTLGLKSGIDADALLPALI